MSATIPARLGVLTALLSAGDFSALSAGVDILPAEIGPRLAAQRRALVQLAAVASLAALVTAFGCSLDMTAGTAKRNQLRRALV